MTKDKKTISIFADRCHHQGQVSKTLEKTYLLIKKKKNRRKYTQQYILTAKITIRYNEEVGVIKRVLKQVIKSITK